MVDGLQQMAQILHLSVDPETLLWDFVLFLHSRWGVIPHPFILGLDM